MQQNAFSGGGGHTVFFTLMEETETLNLRFPRDVAECIQWGWGPHSHFYSHGGNRNLKPALSS
jgi:hypothetical protein